MKKVDFFIVGAQKAGTTSVFEYLKSQKEIIDMPMVKEVMDFSNSKLTFSEIERNIPKYYSSFGKPDRLTGLADVRSLFLSEISAPRIFKYNSQAKIIVMLREPVSRAISSFKFSIKNQHESRRDFDEIISLEEDRILKLSKVDQFANTYLQVSRYSEQLSEFIKYFQGNIHYVIFEDFIRNPKAETIKILDFLEVDYKDKLDEEIFKGKFNVGGTVKSKRIAKFFHKRNILRSLYKVVPLAIRMRIRNKIINPLLKINHSNENIEIEIKDSTKKFLKEIFKSEVESLETITKLDLKNKWGY